MAGRGRRAGQQPPPWPVAGDGAPRYEVCGVVVAFQFFLNARIKYSIEFSIGGKLGLGQLY
jgi:hypothetical protein